MKKKSSPWLWLFLVIPALAVAEDSEEVTLTDRNGGSITATILNANKENVQIKRGSDGKEFILDRTKLDNPSLDKVALWEKELPVKDYEFTVKSIRVSASKSNNYKVSFKLPNGVFVIRPNNGSMARIGFDIPNSSDGGDIDLNFFYAAYGFYVDVNKMPVRNSKDIKDFLNAKREYYVKLATPKNAAEIIENDTWKYVTCGEFAGYTRHSKVSSKYEYYLTNRRFAIRVQLSDSVNAPISPRILRKMIGTFKIKKTND